MINKFLKYLEADDSSENERNLKKLNFLLYALILFLAIYVASIIHSINLKTELIKNTIGLTNNVVVNKTNSINVFLKSLFSEETFLPQQQFFKGDVVIIKHFNIFGVVEGKSILNKSYYVVLYKDGVNRLESFEIPASFLTKVSNNNSITLP